MHIFVTGASGFIGTELVKELIAAGHQVRGMARSDAGIEQLKAAGAEPHRGDLTDLESLKAGATGVDAVVHLAFSHDFANFAQNAIDEQHAIAAIGSVLKPGATFVVTSGTGLASGGPGHLRLETDPPSEHAGIPRKPEQIAKQFVEKGVNVSIVRLSQIHDNEKQGLVPLLTQKARETGKAAYVGDGANRWAACPLPDTAHLYRLVVEKGAPGFTVYHAVQEEGVSVKEISETLAKGLNVPAASITPEEAATHFGWLAGFAGLDMPASSAWTQKELGWTPTGPSLIEDLSNMKY